MRESEAKDIHVKLTPISGNEINKGRVNATLLQSNLSAVKKSLSEKHFLYICLVCIFLEKSRLQGWLSLPAQI
jgi:hypothetical protein